MKLHQRTSTIQAHDCNLANSTFNDVNLAATTFENVNLANCKITDANLKNAAITNANLEGMTIDGILVTDLLRHYRAAPPT